MSGLTALLLSDGRPGHFNLSLGLLAALETICPVSTTRIEVSRGQWSGVPVAAWSNLRLAPAHLLATVYGLDPAELPKADLIVSAGAETLGANVACARILGAANIFYGSLRLFTPKSFDLVLTSFPANASRPRHAFAPKPSPAASMLWKRGRRCASRPPVRLALLVGGNSGETTFTDADWEDLYGLVSMLAYTQGIQWLISNSRRTPNAVSDRLASLPFHRYIDVRTTPAGDTLAGILGDCDAVLVTDESSSMVSDAVATGLAVLGVAPAQHRLTGNELSYRAHLQQKGWYDHASLASLDAGTALAKLCRLTPTPVDPGIALAELLRARLPQLFRA
jgi:uncharacterized protein